MEIIYRLFGIKAEPRMTRFLALQLSADHYFDNYRANFIGLSSFHFHRGSHGRFGILSS